MSSPGVERELSHPGIPPATRGGRAPARKCREAARRCEKSTSERSVYHRGIGAGTNARRASGARKGKRQLLDLLSVRGVVFAHPDGDVSKGHPSDPVLRAAAGALGVGEREKRLEVLVSGQGEGGEALHEAPRAIVA